MTDKAKRKLKNMSFKGENAHMALVSVDQQGPANGVNTLIMKAAEDTSKMNEQQIKSLVEIIKSVQGISDEEAMQVIGNVTDKDTNGASPVSSETVEKASNEAAPVKEEVDNMSDQDLQAEIQKAVEAKQAEIEKALKAQYEEIEKGLKAQIEEYQAKEVEVEKAKYKEVAKGYQVLGIDVEDEKAVEGMAVALMKMKSDETFEPVMQVLEKALNIAVQVEKGAFEEQGHDIEIDSDLSPDEQLKQLIEKSKNSK